MTVVADDATPADERILEATLSVLARAGIAGVSMRAVAREAGVAVGLTNYHFDNKTALICAALRHIGEQDKELVAPANDTDPAEHLRTCLRHAVDPGNLAPQYLSLRLQLWSLAGVDPQFAEINRSAQLRYRSGLADLIANARPELDRSNVDRRAADILIERNGIWLSAVLSTDQEAIQRAMSRCEGLAFD